MSENNDDRGFKVEDRRRFAGAAGAGAEDGGAEAAEAEARSQEAAGEMSRARGGRTAGITFSGFVVGLATQALAFMQGGETAGVERDLEESAALIDVLSLLQEKTAGNLAEDEARLLEEILYDLRMRYVQEKRSPAGRPPGGEESS
jgi:hypothetical protein